MIRNDEQFRQYFYLWLLSDCFKGDFDVQYLEQSLKRYLMNIGYKINADFLYELGKTNLVFTDLDDLKIFYFEEGRI